MSGYQPDDGFRRAVQLLKATMDAELQKDATAKIAQVRKQPAFQNSLMAVLLHGSRFEVPVEVRQCAGLAIKNSLRKHFAPQQKVSAKRLSVMLLREVGCRDGCCCGLSAWIVRVCACAVSVCLVFLVCA